MEPDNAKYFDPDTGLPLDGTHSLPISEVFARALRWLKDNIRPVTDDNDEESHSGVDAGTGMYFGDDRGRDDEYDEAGDPEGRYEDPFSYSNF